MHPRFGISAVLALAAATLALSAASASALQVGVTSSFRPESYGEDTSPAAVVYAFKITDPDGADNNVRIVPAKTAGSAFFDAIRISDSGSVITADPLCVPQSDGAVLCSPPPTGVTQWDSISDGTIDLAAGDDTLTMGLDEVLPSPTNSYQSWKVDAGAGDDRISAPDTPPHSVLVHWTGGPGADAADGNAVTVHYEDRQAPLHVTIGEGADDGEAGEGDDIGPRVVGVIGGSGNDVIRRTAATPTGDAAFGFSPIRDTVISGGDGDDVISTDQYEIGANGGAGNDVLRGGPMDDWLSDSGGNDRLDAGAGNDGLTIYGGGVALGGEGNDQISAYPSVTPRVLDGGPGRDWLGYESEGSVSISLDDVANDGGRSGKDNALGFENVWILKGTLIGSDRDDILTALEGSVFGRGGNDTLKGGKVIDGGTGRDVLRAEEGAVVRAKDGRSDKIICRSSSKIPFPIKQMGRDHSDTVLGCYARAAVLGGVTARGKQAFRAAVQCPKGASTCTGTAYLKDRRGRVVASGRFDQIGAGHSQIVTLTRLRSSHWTRALTVTRSPFNADEFWGRGTLDVRST